MTWYKDPVGHIFELKGRPQHYFCDLCRKIYKVSSGKNQKSEVTLLVWYKGKYYDFYSTEGKKYYQRQRKARAAKQKRKQEIDNSTYRKKHYVLNKKVEREASKSYKETHRNEIRKYHKDYNEEYNKKPSVKIYKREYDRAMRGLFLLGLGVDKKAIWRERQRTKKFLAELNISPQCSMCKASLKLEGKILKCTNCAYWTLVSMVIKK